MTIKKVTLKCLAVIAITVLVGACSSSETSDDEDDDGGDDSSESADASTDNVPPASAETPPPPADSSAQTAPAPVDSAGAAQPATVGTGEFEQYSVQRGDTLMKIAFEKYGDLYQWRKIYEANKDHISNPNKLNVGDALKLEKTSSPVAIDRNGEKYLIRSGDTLGSISQQVYGSKGKWRKIWENNKQLIKDPHKIYAGFYLYYLPGSSETSASPLAGQAPADTGRQPSSGDQPAASAGEGLPAQ